MTLFIFYGSYLYLPFLALCAAIIVRYKGALRILAALALIPPTVLAYARFVEPRILNITEAEIVLPEASKTSPSIRVALFSDTHHGVFQNAMPMRRIVAKVKKQKPDAVFIAGDFVYQIKPEDLAKALAPLQEFDVQVFAVLGNHDIGKPGTNFSAELASALNQLDVTLLDNRVVEANIGGANILVGGAADIWARWPIFAKFPDIPNDKPFLLLAHNPDAALIAPDALEYDLMLAGHTHGGQIRIPFLYKRVLPTIYPFDKGLHTFAEGNIERLVYVTPGTGMVDLPFRFNMPPRIDMLTIRLPETP